MRARQHHRVILHLDALDGILAQRLAFQECSPGISGSRSPTPYSPPLLIAPDCVAPLIWRHLSAPPLVASQVVLFLSRISCPGCGRTNSQRGAGDQNASLGDLGAPASSRHPVRCRYTKFGSATQDWPAQFRLCQLIHPLLVRASGVAHTMGIVLHL